MVQFSGHNIAAYPCGSVEFSADGNYETYLLSYPTLDGGATVHLDHIDIPAPTQDTAPCGNGWSVSIIIEPKSDDGGGGNNDNTGGGGSNLVIADYDLSQTTMAPVLGGGSKVFNLPGGDTSKTDADIVIFRNLVSGNYGSDSLRYDELIFTPSSRLGTSEVRYFSCTGFLEQKNDAPIPVIWWLRWIEPSKGTVALSVKKLALGTV